MHIYDGVRSLSICQYCGEKKSKTIKHLTHKTHKAVRYNSSHGGGIQGGNAALKSSWEGWRPAAEERETQQRQKGDGKLGNIAKGLPW